MKMYEKVFNTLLILTLGGVAFIVGAVPFLIQSDDDEIMTGYKAPALPTVEAPDASRAFEIKANREIAISKLDNAQTIFDAIDHIEPVAVVPPKLVYVGNFYITFYAATIEQCGSTAGITASGRKVTENPECHTVAVDPSVIPLGTYLMIDLPGYESVVFRADDTGGDIKNYWIDVYTDSESLSKTFNPTYADVWIIEEA